MTNTGRSRYFEPIQKGDLVKVNVVPGVEVPEDGKLGGVEEKCLYPIIPKRGTWYLDKGRTKIHVCKSHGNEYRWHRLLL